MKNDPFAPSAAIRAVDKMFSFEKQPTGLEWLVALDAKLGLTGLDKLDGAIKRIERATGQDLAKRLKL
jgi:hypothetical protein